eukprot:scaffold44516_cov15-Phaeocystis_antarctica.AAC.1
MVVVGKVEASLVVAVRTEAAEEVEGATAAVAKAVAAAEADLEAEASVGEAVVAATVAATATVVAIMEGEEVGQAEAPV